VDGRLLERYAKPVFDESGAFRGAIVLDCDMAHVDEILNRLQVGEKGRAYLEDMKGSLVLGERPSFKNLLTGAADIAGTPWRVVVATRAEEFLQPLKQIQDLAILSSLVACLLVMGLILWKVSGAVAPIRTMVQGTQRFAAGDLAHRIVEPETEE